MVDSSIVSKVNIYILVQNIGKMMKQHQILM